VSDPKVLVEVWSDVACPWCYVGERRLFRALDARPDRDRFEVVFRPFELDPEAPPRAEPLRNRLERRYGALAAAMTRRAGEAAAVEGIAADWDAALSARTHDAHRLLAVAGREGGEATQRRLAELLFAAQFEHGGDVGDRGQLAALAAAAGMDEGRAREVLASAEGEEEVGSQLARARRLGIRSVPTFVFGERYALEGAQPVAAFERVLAALAAEAASADEPQLIAPPRDPAAGCADGLCAAPSR
jgi:predicted DsbA family dithiol-disulfide isomerase